MKDNYETEDIGKLKEVIIALIQYDIAKYSQDEYKNNIHLENLMRELDNSIERVNLLYQKNQVTRLKRWYKEITESHRHEPDFFQYFVEKTGYHIESPNIGLEKRINKIIKRKKIITENEYRDVMEMISELNVKNEPEKLDALQKLIDEYDENH